MHLHYFQHIRFEDLGLIADWAQDRGHDVTRTPFFEPDYKIPEPGQYDALVMMGGPMGVHDTDKYPWLTEEKEAIRRTVDANKPVLGICLGAQLLANCLGADVTDSPEKEIGWFPITLTGAGKDHGLLSKVKQLKKVLHWHGDMFGIPPGATRIASSEGCPNQAFLLGENVLGLQFHLEMPSAKLAKLVAACAEDLRSDAPFIQKAEEILAEAARTDTGPILYDVLDKWAATFDRSGF